MGSHIGHSRLVYGFQVGVEVELVDRNFSRFDPKTGQPMNVSSKTFVSSLVLKDQSRTISLPDETDTYEESHQSRGGYPILSPAFNDWVKTRLSQKIYDFFKAAGLEEDGVKKDLYYWRESYYQMSGSSLAVGVEIISGHGENARLVVVSPDLIEAAKEVFYEKIGPLSYLVFSLSLT